jgi:hypothetical protein
MLKGVRPWGDSVIVEMPLRSRLFVDRKRNIVLISIAALLTLGVIVGVCAHISTDRNIAARQAAIHKAQQATAQTGLDVALRNLDNQSAISYSTQLISGVKSGEYTANNATLAMYYMDRGASRINLHMYASAFADYQTALKLDSSVQSAALQGEVTAGYGEGQRRQLIPLLQQLKRLAYGDNSSLDDTPAQIQGDIQDVQNNQEPDF